VARRYLIRTFGCQMNEHDSEHLAGLLESEGMVPTDDVERADLVVLNTCCIRENADNRLYGHLGQLKAVQSRHPDMQIAVGGCLAQKDRELVRRRAPHVDVVFGTHNVSRAPELLRTARQQGPVVEVLDEAAENGAGGAAPGLPVRRNLDYAAWVTIQTGCDNSCSFCIVPAVRGREVSRPFGEVVAEVESLARAGVSEVTLLGQNVNSYGRDITLELRRHRADAEHRAGTVWSSESTARPRPLFADLLRAVGAVRGVKRVRYTSPHPKDLRPETVMAMAETASVCEQLHLPLQSGSDRVLASMRRGYTAERYLERLALARAHISDLAVTTDVIVGFPGETDADFDQTLEVVAEAAYDSAYTFVFSPRPGTRAASMTDAFVSAEVVAERFSRLKVVVDRSCLARNRDRIGRVEEVLVEGPSRRNPAMTSGRTRQNKLVHFPAEGRRGPVGAGSYASVLVTSAAPHHLIGELKEVLSRPRRRGRLAVTAGSATPV
jgi:tRNA-2-methylthio-N6-dimethylallyladenosine synthase